MTARTRDTTDLKSVAVHDELPEGWVGVPLREVTEPVPNINPADEPNRVFGYIDISSICNQTFRVTDPKEFKGVDAPSRARRPIRPGDVLFSNVRTYLRNVALITDEVGAQVCSTGFTVMRPTCRIEPRYLFRYVLSQDFIDRVTPLQTGSNYPATSDRVVLGEKIPLPPLAEQRRIVEKVEALLARVDAARNRLAAAPGILKRFRQAVLAAACSGRLTADWREDRTSQACGVKLLEDVLRERRLMWYGMRSESKKTYEIPAAPSPGYIPDLPASWSVASLEQLTSPVRVICYGILMPKDNVPDGVPYVKVKDIKNDRINVEGLCRTASAIAAAFSRSSLKPGDLLIAIRGSYGRVATVPESLDGANITQDTARLDISPLLDRAYIALYLRNPSTQHFFRDVARGIAVRGVNIGDLRLTPIAVPCLTEQQEIVRRVEALFALADRVEQRVAAASARADRLTRAVLGKAFRGELVPQDPADQPVGPLLERARGEGQSGG